MLSMPIHYIEAILACRQAASACAMFKDECLELAQWVWYHGMASSCSTPDPFGPACYSKKKNGCAPAHISTTHLYALRAALHGRSPIDLLPKSG